ncbi:ABC transporter permease [Kitasatospora sp. NPDC056138]|uniref:ABC transporter permease n=1 Tax=Kitasatospora sp. NPDC056138 TaxID=3345724 RepID=UPI0035DBD590
MSTHLSTATEAGTRTPVRPRSARQSLGWLMWRQQRLTIALWLAVIAVAVVAFPFLRSEMVDYIDTKHIAGCAEISLDPRCQGVGMQQAVEQFRESYGLLIKGIGLLLLLLPAMAGVFVGAPLFARELESGTWRLVLAQSVGRRRWTAAKLVTAGLVGALGSATLMMLYRWLWQPSANDVSGVAWSARVFIVSGGPVLIATVLLALAVGATVGALLGRVVPAMGVTLAVVAALQYGMSVVRPYLWSSETMLVPRSSLPNDVWGFGQGYQLPDGTRLAIDACTSSSDYAACLGNAREYSEVHRASDYWPLQGVESGICLVLAAALVVFLLVRTRRSV